MCVCTLSWWLNLHYVRLVYIKWVLRISRIIMYSTRDLCTIHNAAVIVKYNKRRVFTAQPGAFRIYYCYYNLFLFFSSSTRRWLGESEALCACTVQCAYCIFFFRRWTIAYCVPRGFRWRARYVTKTTNAWKLNIIDG